MKTYACWTLIYNWSHCLFQCLNQLLPKNNANKKNLNKNDHFNIHICLQIGQKNLIRNFVASTRGTKYIEQALDFIQESTIILSFIKLHNEDTESEFRFTFKTVHK